MNTESNCSDLGGFTDGLNEGSLSFGILELNGLDATLIIQISSVLIIRDTFGECRLCDKVSRLLIQVLLKVSSNDNVHRCCLSDLVLVQTAVLVSFENERTKLSQ